jgi:gamma-D-glutamyl-L-lysine dipeptidyl-peptidase
MSTLVLALVLAAARPEAVVVRSVENMYTKASADAEVTSQAILGETVAVLERKPGFARIETPDTYRGWIALGALREYAGPQAPRYAARGEVLEIVTLMASVYREASATSARPRIRAPLGARLESSVPAVSERWLRVRLPSGEPGFIQSGDVRRVDATAAPPRGSGDDVVATARRLLGVPYQWGGMTAAGIDCSGLTSLAYGVNGLVLLRDADIQITDPRFVEVDRSELRAGDLVFFGKTKDHITHVGLYEADGRFISATTHLVPVVQESSLDEPHWAQLYQGARRPR